MRGARYGLPVAARRVYLPRLLAQGRPVMVIGEKDKYLTAVTMRAPLCRYEALTAGEAAPGATGFRESGASATLFH